MSVFYSRTVLILRCSSLAQFCCSMVSPTLPVMSALVCLLTSVPGYDAFIPHFKASTFVLKYLGIVIFCGNVLVWKLVKRTKRVRATAVDLVTGRQDAGAPEEEETDNKVSRSGRVAAAGRRWIVQLTSKSP